MKAGDRRTTRCWVTGVEVRIGDSWVLDQSSVCEKRAVVAERLALLDHLLADFGPSVGDSARGVKLGLPRFAHRAVSKAIADLYNGRLDGDRFFVSWEENKEIQFLRWKSFVVSDNAVGSRFSALTDMAWRDLHTTAGFFRTKLRQPHKHHAIRTKLDACVALICPAEFGATLRDLDTWLDETGSTVLLEMLNLPRACRIHATDALEERCRLASAPRVPEEKLRAGHLSLMGDAKETTP